MDNLNELLEEHAPNLDVLDSLTLESFRNLYVSLVVSLIEIQEEE